MNRYLPCLTALLLALPLAARAAVSNRVADGGSEPASAWLKIKFHTRDGLDHEYWCHASDCDPDRFKGPSKKINTSTHRAVGCSEFGACTHLAYITDIPLYTLWPARDAMVSLPTFRAVKAPYELGEMGLEPFNGTPERPWFAFKGSDDKNVVGTVDLDARIAGGDIVVLPDEGAETGKPMELGTVAGGQACEKSDFYLYYGEAAGEKKLLDKAFTPLEFDLENAQLYFFPNAARVRSGTINGRDFSAIAHEAAIGNLRIADDFVGQMRQNIRTMAQLYVLNANNFSQDALEPFEQRFLLCVMGYAEKRDDFRLRVLAARGNPSAFAQSWRKFIQTELSRYIGAPPPAGFTNKDAVEAADWKPAWDQLNADAISWLDTGALPAPPAPPAPPPPPPAPVVVPHPVAPPAPPKPNPRVRPAPADPDEEMRKALGGS